MGWKVLAYLWFHCGLCRRVRILFCSFLFLTTLNRTSYENYKSFSFKPSFLIFLNLLYRLFLVNLLWRFIRNRPLHSISLCPWTWTALFPSFSFHISLLVFLLLIVAVLYVFLILFLFFLVALLIFFRFSWTVFPFFDFLNDYSLNIFFFHDVFLHFEINEITSIGLRV